MSTYEALTLRQLLWRGVTRKEALEDFHAYFSLRDG
jgi:hypothetical protein